MSTHYKDYYGTHMPFGQFPKFGVLSSVKVLMTGTNITITCNMIRKTATGI